MKNLPIHLRVIGTFIFSIIIKFSQVFQLIVYSLLNRIELYRSQAFNILKYGNEKQCNNLNYQVCKQRTTQSDKIVMKNYLVINYLEYFSFVFPSLWRSPYTIFTFSSFLFPSFFFFLLSFCQKYFPGECNRRMYMLYRIRTRAQGNCRKPVPIQSAI